ncbi:Uncharacterized protein, PA2063/DUF2235 family [Pseudosulfitobacter pseudonitzschiae]|uniref:T6SS Phospholipase effector Tle1-like catalytic domain-containing protein n=1 Tax=Pseudosulfitobacter pseudonitzschiae TaxID=1402135 RepID=A0A073J6I8_9RHOB|nr:DUF2235 domain-containing protein [Pseudosulfitobacter pseudonitzschiae]KEJ98253.1 hypothetical protein SUH3_04450 [Pseudosulfitobacter pseudonitzschiae]QKS09485.1 DUF2235 domain-containing protein [Pseudosulfitobacter pseudonitzschiae]SHE41346.1 Uncharacterized protein, PA2063/DUF2235 family [Pseudosulfitobacter pseudonitzschiae]
MSLSRLNRAIAGWLRGRFRSGAPTGSPRRRGPTTHVIILDGTMSTLMPDFETNAGLTYKLLHETGSDVSVYYESGLQWSHWRRAGDVLLGRGINRQIRRAYGYLASRYRPGDTIFLMGYSRGAYAVRSLAGIVGFLGLLKAESATERNIREVYRHYEAGGRSDAARAFARMHCHADVPIEMIGVWDTVKSLGLNAPVLWRFSAPNHSFHDHQLGPHVKHGYHALARNETRMAYAPVMWETRNDWHGHLEQMWFRGTHGDVGGQLGGFDAARPLSNISLVWMLEKAESCGLPLPEGWAARFPQDPLAPSVGTWRGFGGLFITRRARKVGLDPSERVHPSVAEAARAPSRSWWSDWFRGASAH